MKEILFTKQKMASFLKISKDYFETITFTSSMDGDDFITQCLTTKLEACFLAAGNEYKEVVIYSKKPTFLEWILRKKRKFVFKFNCKEILKNPPKLPPNESILIYEVTGSQ